MNIAPTLDAEKLVVNFVRLAKAVRFAFVMVVVILSYIAIRTNLCVLSFGQIFHDMLNGQPLPTITTFVLAAYPFLILTSLAVPLVAIGSLFSNRLVGSFYLLGTLTAFSAMQVILVSQGLLGPLFQIINNLSGMQGR